MRKVKLKVMNLKKEYSDLNIKTGDDMRQVMKIETQHFFPIKFALLKFL